MKKSFIYVLSGALCILSACNKEIEKPEENQESSGEKKMITELVSVKSENDGNETKVAIDGSNTYQWTSNDYMAFFVTNNGGTTYEKRETASSINTETKEFTLSYEEGYTRGGYGVIPASFAKSLADGKLTVTYPDSYDISAYITDDYITNGRYDNRGAYIPVPMVAVNSGDNMTFYSIGALVKVTMSNIPAGTKTLYVTFNQVVTGDFTVTNPGTATPTVEVADTENKTTVAITVSEDGLTPAQAANPIVLYIPVPTTTGLGIASSATTKATVSRNKGYAWSVPAITYTGNKGYFQVTDGTFVFAPGNLLAHKDDKGVITYSFEDPLISTRGAMNDDPHLTGEKGDIIGRSIDPLLSDLPNDRYQDVFCFDVIRAIVGDLETDPVKGASYYIADNSKYTWDDPYYDTHDYYNFATNSITIDGKNWAVPTESFWESFTRQYTFYPGEFRFDVNRTGILATVCGVTRAQYAKVKILVTGNETYDGYGYEFSDGKLYIPGTFFFPDGYVDQTDLVGTPNTRPYNYLIATTISYDQFEEMISNGAVFLNASGQHLESNEKQSEWNWNWVPGAKDRYYGYYIGSTFSFDATNFVFVPHAADKFYGRGFNCGDTGGAGFASRSLLNSTSVRLVREVVADGPSSSGEDRGAWGNLD